MKVYEKIEQIRKRKGVTRKHIADRCGKSPAWYTDISKGRRGINAETLPLIADALEVNVRSFFDDELSETLSEHDAEFAKEVI